MSSVVDVQHQAATTAPSVVSVTTMPSEVAIMPDGQPAMVAVENSSPEVIHVVNVSNAMTTPNSVTSQMVTMAGQPTQPGVQTITLSAGNFSFPISVATPLVRSVVTRCHLWSVCVLQVYWTLTVCQVIMKCQLNVYSSKSIRFSNHTVLTASP